MWYPASIPPLESGYYLTYNFNEEVNSREDIPYRYKGIWWNANEMQWSKWYRSPRLPFHVLYYWNSTGPNKFYIPCEMQEDVTELRV